MAIYLRVNSIDIAYTEHQYSRFTNSSHYILTVMCVNLAGIQPLFEPHSQALWAFRDWRCFEGYLNRQPAWNPRSLCTKDNQEPKECLRYHGSGWGSYVGRRLEGTGLVHDTNCWKKGGPRRYPVTWSMRIPHNLISKLKPASWSIYTILFMSIRSALSWGSVI